MAAQASTDALPGAPDGRVRWRRVLTLLLVAVAGILVALHDLGGGAVAVIGAAAAGIAIIGFAIVRRFSARGRDRARQRRWQVEFRRSGGAVRRGSLNYPSQRGKGLLKPSRPGSGRVLPRLRRSGGAMLSSPRSRPRRASPGHPPTRRRGGGSGRFRGLSGGSGRSRGLMRGSRRSGGPAGRPKTGFPGRRRPGTGLRLPRAGSAGSSGRRAGTGLRLPRRSSGSPGRRSTAGTVRRRAAGITGRRRTGAGLKGAGIPGRRPRRAGTAGSRGPGILARRHRILSRRAGAGTRRTGIAGRGRGGSVPPRPGGSGRMTTMARPGRRHPIRRARWNRLARRQRISPQGIPQGRVTPPRQQRVLPRARPGWRHPVRRAQWNRAQRARRPWRPSRWQRASYRARRGWRLWRGKPAPGYLWWRQPRMNPLWRRWRVRRGRMIPGGWTPEEQRRYRRRAAYRRLPWRERYRQRRYRLTAWWRNRPPPEPLARGGPSWWYRFLLRLDRRRMSRWVAHRRRRRAPAQAGTPVPPQGRPPAPSAKPGPELVPPPPGTYLPPSSNGHGSSTGGKRLASRIEAVNEVLQEQLGSWEPDSATDTKEMLEALPGLFENLGNVLSTMAERLGDHAVEPAVTEELREAAAGADGQREAFENVYKTFRATHEHDLQRLEEPRPGEKDWDVTQNE